MRPLKNICEVAVIGGGLAGLSAARHAVRLGRLVTLFEGSGLYGGILATVGEVDGLPVPGNFSGQDLAIHLLQDARKTGVQVIEIGIAKIDLDRRLTLTDQESKTYYPEPIVIASGASHGERPVIAAFFVARIASSSVAETVQSMRPSDSPSPAGASSWCAPAR